MPYAVDSSSFHPAPTPSSSRPSEITSSVAAIFASTAGWRYGMPVTRSPMRSRFVACASAVVVTQPSRHGPVESEKIG